MCPKGGETMRWARKKSSMVPCVHYEEKGPIAEIPCTSQPGVLGDKIIKWGGVPISKKE